MTTRGAPGGPRLLLRRLREVMAEPVNAQARLDRIVVHEMGVRSRASCEVGSEGILLRREGARDLFVPAENLFSVGTARGIAGKAYERGGVLVVTWDLGDKVVDTGFRADAAEDQERLLAVLQGLVGQQTPAEEGTT